MTTVRSQFPDRVEYRLNGKLHREDGPAIEWASGNKSWWFNGKCHRTDGPARELVNGDKEWYLNGLVHRIDGPAFEGEDGIKIWYLNDKEVSKQEVDDCRYQLFQKALVLNRRSYKFLSH
jgi:hypothetical protein